VYSSHDVIRVTKSVDPANTMSLIGRNCLLPFDFRERLFCVASNRSEVYDLIGAEPDRRDCSSVIPWVEPLYRGHIS
jgi:hypothetical protein